MICHKSLWPYNTLTELISSSLPPTPTKFLHEVVNETERDVWIYVCLRVATVGGLIFTEFVQVGENPEKEEKKD